MIRSIRSPASKFLLRQVLQVVSAQDFLPEATEDLACRRPRLGGGQRIQPAPQVLDERRQCVGVSCCPLVAVPGVRRGVRSLPRLRGLSPPALRVRGQAVGPVVAADDASPTGEPFPLCGRRTATSPTNRGVGDQGHHLIAAELEARQGQHSPDRPSQDPFPGRADAAAVEGQARCGEVLGE